MKYVLRIYDRATATVLLRITKHASYAQARRSIADYERRARARHPHAIDAIQPAEAERDGTTRTR